MTYHQDKTAFLSRVRQAVNAGTAKRAKEPAPAVRQGIHTQRYADADLSELLALFQHMVKERNYHLHLITAQELGKTLKEIVDRCQAKHLVCADNAENRALGLVDLLETAGELYLWRPEASRQEILEHVASADLGVTIASLGVADIGTIIEESRADCGKVISLLPENHVSILYASRVVPTLTGVSEYYERRHAAGDWPASFIHISGPSSTGDIESILVTGAHGPVREDYILLTDK